MKAKLQARQAALSFTEKIKILEKLRDRERMIAAAGLRNVVPTKPCRRRSVYCEHGALTPEIMRLAQDSIELVHFPYDPNSHVKKVGIAAPSAARIGDLNLPWKQLPGRWADYGESSRLPEILSILCGTKKTDTLHPNRRDALHIDSAFKQGCVAFVTNDNHILDRRADLERLVGMRFFRPTEYGDLEKFISNLDTQS